MTFGPEQSITTAYGEAARFALGDFSKHPRNECQLFYRPTCGDGIIEKNETCEDGNMNSGDGCSASCVLELPSCFASGTILNGTTGRISEIFTATIARSGTVRSGVKLTGFSRGEVSNLSLNQDLTGANYQEFTTGIQFTSTGQKILTGFLRNQNIGPQECFLGEVEIFHCGDGVIQDGTNGTPDLGETCDDGNTIDGDGCSASCALEDPALFSGTVCGFLTGRIFSGATLLSTGYKITEFSLEIESTGANIRPSLEIVSANFSGELFSFDQKLDGFSRQTGPLTRDVGTRNFQVEVANTTGGHTGGTQTCDL